MNLILMKAGFLPVVINKERREEYYQALLTGDQGDLTPFRSLIGKEAKASLESSLAILTKKQS